MKPNLLALLVLTVIAACHALADSAPDRSPRLMAIGKYLSEQAIAGTVKTLKDSRTVPDIVRIGPTLPEVLAEMRAELQAGYSVESQLGDASGEGGEVTHSIIIRTPHDSICLRMRYDSSLDRFHIVGYCGAPPPKSK